MASWVLSKYIEIKLKTRLLSSHIRLIQNKRGLKPVSLPHFRTIFEEKCFSWYILLIDQISLSNCLFFVRFWAILVSQLFANQVVTSWIFKLILPFQSSRFSYMTKKSWQNVNILRTERTFKMKQKAFFIIFNGISIKQITQIFLEGESQL